MTSFPKPLKKEKKLTIKQGRKLVQKIERKKSKLSPIRKTKKSTLKNKADKLFSLRVRELGYCQLAGKDKVNCGGGLQCMHIVGRANYRLRWSKGNALCGCAGHHRYYTSHAFDFYELIKKHFPGHYTYIQAYKNEVWDKDINKVLESLNG